MVGSHIQAVLFLWNIPVGTCIYGCTGCVVQELMRAMSPVRKINSIENNETCQYSVNCPRGFSI